MRLALLILVTCAQLAGAAVNLYVDFDGGSDAAAGTSTGTAFRTIPGTYDAAGVALLQTYWGAYSNANRIPDNTTIWVKSGTVHDSGSGGYCWMAGSSASVYTDGCTNIVIKTDTSWGDGTPAVLDGSGITVGISLLLIQTDGVAVRGITFRDSDQAAIQAKEKGDGSALTNLIFADLILTNNGVSYADDLAGSGDGQINVRRGQTVIVSNCLFYGASRFINGLLLGNTGKEVLDYQLLDSIARDHNGDTVDNDCGIGFKLINTRGFSRNCQSFDNLKGWDVGEQNGVGMISNVVYNCAALRNYWGINYNGPAAAYAYPIRSFTFNNVIVSNLYNGLNIYSGPFKSYLVNNTIIYNGFARHTNGGGSDNSLYNVAQITINPNDSPDTNEIEFVALNNVLHESPTNATTFLNKYGSYSNWFTTTIDFNSYQSYAGTYFAIWDAYVGGDVYAYVTHGPGRTSGNWYSYYYNDATPPALGTGHYHNDSNSKGKGCTDTTICPLDSQYVPTGSYPGTNYSSASWFLPEMAYDRNGRARSEWTVGAEEVTTFGAASGGSGKNRNFFRPR